MRCSFGALVAHAAAASTDGVVGYVLVGFPYLMAPSRFPVRATPLVWRLPSQPTHLTNFNKPLRPHGTQVCPALPKLLVMGDADDVSLGAPGLAAFQVRRCAATKQL
jgi:hypothetical protein